MCVLGEGVARCGTVCSTLKGMAAVRYDGQSATSTASAGQHNMLSAVCHAPYVLAFDPTSSLQAN